VSEEPARPAEPIVRRWWSPIMSWWKTVFQWEEEEVAPEVPSETGGSEAEPRQRDAGELYRQYATRERGRYCAARITLMGIAYFLFALWLFEIGDFPNRPYRGTISLWLGQIILVLAVGAMIVLIFFVLDATLSCLRFVRRLVDKDCRWPAEGIKEVIERRGETREDDLCRLLAVQLIAGRTRVVGKLMYYPCIVVVLMVLARHPALDDWSYPWPLILLSALAFGAAVFCAIALGLGASKARKTILGRLNDSLSLAYAEQAGGGRARLSARQQRLDRKRIEQIKLIIKEIAEERQGAFSPLSSNPVVNALAIPATGLLVLYQLMGWL
jgi:hypothetical protein